MEDTLNAQQIERRAYSATRNTGLFEIYVGALVMAVGFFMTMLDWKIGVGWSFAIYLVVIGAAVGIHRYAFHRIKARRLGNAVFGEERKKKERKVRLAFVAGFIVTTGIVLATMFLWKHPTTDAPLNIPMLMAAIWAFQIIAVFAVLAYYWDQPRMFLLGVILGATVPTDLALREFAEIAASWIVYGAGGLMLVLLGVALFARFVRENPVYEPEASDE
ncbi:hypothetical protein KQI84_07415 [bacterium]|nr:hypothetical protein [bacterium]